MLNKDKILTSAANLVKVVWNVMVNVCVYVLYYAPIIRTRLIEWLTFYIPIFDHNTPIKLNDLDNIIITSCSAGKPGRKLVNVFYKYYTPYSIDDFESLNRKYLGVSCISFVVYKYNRINFLEECGQRILITINTITNVVTVNGKEIEIKMNCVGLNKITAVNEEKKD